MDYSVFTDRLDNVRACGNHFSAKCPAHADKSNSLAFTEGPEKIQFKCFAGCSGDEVIAAMGLQWQDIYNRPDGARQVKGKVTGEWLYRDETGKIIFKTCRMDFSDGSKSFFQRAKLDGKWVNSVADVRKIPYNLHLISSGKFKTIFVPEGEKHCDLLTNWGFLATCCPGGADSWKYEYGQYLTGMNVVVLPDNDEPGMRYASAVCGSAILHSALSVRVVTISNKPKGDVVDWAMSGGSRSELLRIALDSKKWGTHDNS